MQSKIRLVMGATALLYLGPLLAGLAGQGWAAVPVFILTFLLWSIVMRPSAFPRAASAWTRPHIWIGALVQLAVQSLLVLLLFGIGRGIGGVAGVLPVIHPALPVAVSALSIPLTRLIWDPVKAEKLDAVLDDALRQINGLALQGQRSQEEDDRRKAELDAEIARIRARLEAGETDLRALHGKAPAWQLLQAVSDLKADRGLTPALSTALVDFATDPALSMELQGQEAPFTAFMLVRDDPQATARFAERYAALLKADAEAFWDGPNNAVLRHAERAHAGTPAEPALHALRVAQYRMTRARRDRERALAGEEEWTDNPAP